MKSQNLNVGIDLGSCVLIAHPIQTPASSIPDDGFPCVLWGDLLLAFVEDGKFSELVIISMSSSEVCFPELQPLASGSVIFSRGHPGRDLKLWQCRDTGIWKRKSSNEKIYVLTREQHGQKMCVHYFLFVPQNTAEKCQMNFVANFYLDLTETCKMLGQVHGELLLPL